MGPSVGEVVRSTPLRAPGLVLAAHGVGCLAGFACAAASSVLAALRLLTGAPSLRLVRRLPGTSAAWAREWAPVIAQIKRIHRLRKMKRHGLKGTRSFIIGYLRRTGHKASGPLCEDPSSGIETRKASESIQNWIKRPRTKAQAESHHLSVNPKDERVFTREAGKKLYQRTKGKPCKKSFADELSAQSRSVTTRPIAFISCADAALAEAGDLAGRQPRWGPEKEESRSCLLLRPCLKVGSCLLALVWFLSPSRRLRTRSSGR